MPLPVPVRYALPQVVIVPEADDIDYDCVPVKYLPKVTPIEAVRKHEQEEFLADIYNEHSTYRRLMIRYMLIWNPYFWMIRR